MATQGQVDPKAALELYAWNAEISGALLFPLHVCEVAIRNAVAEVLETIHGEHWPREQAFKRLLHKKMRDDLQTAANKAGNTTSKVIPELTFSFWQHMFTSRYDSRIWNKYLHDVLPNLPPGQSISEPRAKINDHLERVRILRNRIAHHEPIFKRNLQDDYDTILRLVGWRCQFTADWMDEHQRVRHILGKSPLLR
ncbi:MAG: Abi family protein [Lautropia sp.]|nr:Abi family protein [Lautropia sp.]